MNTELPRGQALFQPILEEMPSAAAEDVGTQFDFRHLVAIVRRNLWYIVVIVGLALIGGLIVTMLITPKYVASARIQIDQESDRVIESGSVQPVSSYQDADRFLQTQIDVLKSRSIALRVAQALNLFGNANFFSAMGAVVPAAGTAASARTVTREATVGLLSGNLAIDLPRESRIVTIAFESADAAMAARIANAYASEFIQSNLQRKFDSSAYARGFLERQLAEAKSKLEASERAVNDYSRSANLIRTSPVGPTSGGSTNSSSITTSNLVQLNAAANEARSSRITAEQKWLGVQRSPLLSVPEVLSNQAVQRLLDQRSSATAALRQERARHLDEYPTVRQLSAQVDEVNGQLNALASSIRQSIRQDYETAVGREQALASAVSGFQNDTLAEQDRSVRYNILAREADTNRTLYDGLLQRYKELSAAAGISSNNVSIIDEADVPLSPSSPKLFLNLLIAMVAGLALAGIVIFIREQLDDAIRVPEDLERKLSLPILGAIPVSPVGTSIVETLNAPRSAIAEAYHALRTSLLYSTMGGLPKSILVTSTQASEGKSTTSFATASGLARLGKRVLLIDVDLRRPSLHRFLGVPNLIGMSDLLTTMEPEAVIQSTPIENLSFIPSGPIPPSPTELLGSARMSAMFVQLGDIYDVIVMDAPPVLGLADAPLLSTFADGTVFVVESNRGNRGATKAALRRLRSAQGRVIGAVLTKFDPKRAGNGYTYYGYDYYQYGNKGDAVSTEGA